MKLERWEFLMKNGNIKISSKYFFFQNLKEKETKKGPLEGTFWQKLSYLKYCLEEEIREVMVNYGGNYYFLFVCLKKFKGEKRKRQ